MSDARVTAIEERIRAPLTVAVHGRRGVGVGAVIAALTGSGVTAAADAENADAQVFVVAEALKPEDRAHLRGASRTPGSSVPTMVVLNKADLTGADPGGPLACAERRAADFAARVGLPVVPMIATLAAVGLDEDDVSALHTLVAAPADMTSTDAFVCSDHRLPMELRRRLLDRLDRFGLAHALLAVADGATGADVKRQLRALSQVDRVLGQLAAVTAPVCFRRVQAALGELRVLAAQSRDTDLEEFLRSDEVVIAVMAAAVDVVEAAGVAVEPGEEPEAHLRRAVRWEAYASGPVRLMHQRCAKDIARGSLRLLGRVQ